MFAEGTGPISSTGEQNNAYPKKDSYRRNHFVLKSKDLSFREIAERLGKSLGSVSGRYYRGVRHAAQINRDAQLKKLRNLRRVARNKERSLVAIQAAIEMRNGIEFSVAVGRAREAGATMEMIGAWWERRAIDPVATARMLWISTRRIE